MVTDITFEVVDGFVYRDRICVIVKANVPEEISRPLRSWCNGYVSVSNTTKCRLLEHYIYFKIKKCLNRLAPFGKLLIKIAKFLQIVEKKYRFSYFPISYWGYDVFNKKINSEKLTFSGRLTLSVHTDKLKGMYASAFYRLYFFGFDSNHFGDNEFSKSQEAVKNRTMLLANEMVEKGI